MHASIFFSLVASALVAFAAPQKIAHSPSPTEPATFPASSHLPPANNPVASPTHVNDGTASASSVLPPAAYPSPSGIESCIIVPVPTAPGGQPASSPGVSTTAVPSGGNASVTFYSVYYPVPTFVDGNESGNGTAAAPSASGEAPSASVIPTFVLSASGDTPSASGVSTYVAPSVSGGVPVATTYSCVLGGPIPPSATIIFPNASPTPPGNSGVVVPPTPSHVPATPSHVPATPSHVVNSVAA